MLKTYRAVQFTEYGGPEVLHVVDREVPRPGPGEVLVEVRAAGVNPLDWQLRSGAAAAMMPVEFPAVPGGDVAGVVVDVGKDVTDFAAGDEVFGSIGFGSYAEFVLAPAAQIARKPGNVPWEIAAGLPVAANTAYQALCDLDVKAGETLVVDGAMRRCRVRGRADRQASRRDRDRYGKRAQPRVPAFARRRARDLRRGARRAGPHHRSERRGRGIRRRRKGLVRRHSST